MKRLTEMYVWIAEDATRKQEMIPGVVTRSGEHTALTYSNVSPAGLRDEIDKMAERAAKQFFKTLRLVRFDASGMTIVREISHNAEARRQQ